MIIDKEDNLKLNLDQTSYKNSDIKALTRKLVYNKNVSAEQIGFICFLVPILLSIILSIIESIFPKIAFLNQINIIIGVIVSALLITYIFIKSINTIHEKKVGIKYIFNTNVFIIFFITLILFGLFTYILYGPINHMFLSLISSKMVVKSLFSHMHSTNEFINFLINFIILFIIKDLIKNLILYVLSIIGFLIIFNIFIFPAYICSTSKISIFDGLKTGIKLSFLNMKKLLKIEFSFFHIIFFIIPIPLLFIWKGLYIFTAISVVVEKSFKTIAS